MVKGRYCYVFYNVLAGDSNSMADSSVAALPQNDRIKNPSLIVILSVSEGSDNEKAGYARVVKRKE